MSNVLQFPPCGEKVREVPGWRMHVAIDNSRTTHSARVVPAVYHSKTYGRVKGHTTRTDCGLLLGFIPEDKFFSDDVTANIKQTCYREEYRGLECARCKRVIASELSKMLEREKKGSKQ